MNKASNVAYRAELGSFPPPLIIAINHNMYLLTEWEGRTGKYLARGQDVRTERSEVRAS